MRERERDLNEKRKTLFFPSPPLPEQPPMSAPLPKHEYFGRKKAVVTLWGSSCRPCQSRVYREKLRQAGVRFLSIISGKKRCAAPLGFQLSWKLRLGNRHVTRFGQSPAGLLPEDIPLHESMRRSRAHGKNQTFVFLCLAAVQITCFFDSDN